MLKLVAGVGLLVAHHALLAKLDVPGQTVVDLAGILGDVGGVFGVVNVDIAGIFFHIFCTPIGGKTKKTPFDRMSLSNSAFAVTVIIPRSSAGCKS